MVVDAGRSSWHMREILIRMLTGAKTLTTDMRSVSQTWDFDSDFVRGQGPGLPRTAEKRNEAPPQTDEMHFLRT